MAFCPECGKPTAADAVNCEQCGHALPSQPKKKAAAGRFNGTVMMAAVPSAAKAVVAAARPERVPVGAASAEPLPNLAAPATKHAETVLGVGRHAAPAAGVPAKATNNAHATMIGAGMAPAVLHAAQAQQAAARVIASPEPPDPDAATTSGTQPATRTGHPVEDEARLAAQAPTLFAGTAQASKLEPIVLHTSQHRTIDQPEPRQYLPGDPMAPAAQPGAATRTGSTRLRLAEEDSSTSSLAKTERSWLYWAVGGVALICILLLGFGFGLF